MWIIKCRYQRKKTWQLIPMKCSLANNQREPWKRLPSKVSQRTLAYVQTWQLYVQAIKKTIRFNQNSSEVWHFYFQPGIQCNIRLSNAIRLQITSECSAAIYSVQCAIRKSTHLALEKSGILLAQLNSTSTASFLSSSAVKSLLGHC